MRRRTGFTLVEMLVAIALTVFVMVILSQAFSAGLETFRQLKGIGDMQSGMRSAATRLRADLEAEHFGDSRKLSDTNYIAMGPQAQGFFKLEYGGDPIFEGNDPDGIPSYRSVDHRLHFSVKLRGNRREHFASATVPANSPLLALQTNYAPLPPDARFQEGNASYHSPWLEVAYFLVKTGTTVVQNDPADTQGTPLHALYRVQRVVLPEASAATALNLPAAQLASYQELSCKATAGGTLEFYSPADLVNPAKRAISFTTNPGLGASPLLENVVSFQVQVRAGAPGVTANRLTVFNFLPGTGARFYDAAGTFAINYQVSAVQVTLRVWDPATQQTRQMSFIQDM
jgi:prepilin-type N-terminal cleavage/methylation domain-containing protein